MAPDVRKNPLCSACGNAMDLTQVIPPFGTPYGLKIYTCSECGHSSDYMFATSPSRAHTKGAV
jgi:hypothetical protein